MSKIITFCMLYKSIYYNLLKETYSKLKHRRDGIKLLLTSSKAFIYFLHKVFTSPVMAIADTATLAFIGNFTTW